MLVSVCLSRHVLSLLSTNQCTGTDLNLLNASSPSEHGPDLNLFKAQRQIAISQYSSLIFAGNTPATYTNWAEGSAPDHKGLNCMQFVSGTDMEELGMRGQWGTFECTNDFINTHALCQLKYEIVS